MSAYKKRYENALEKVHWKSHRAAGVCSYDGCNSLCPAGTVSCFAHCGCFDPFPFVYFILAEAVGKLKIGTSVDVKKRLSALRVSSAVPLRLVHAIGGGVQVERWCHYQVRSEHSHYEWFDWTETTKRFVKQLASHGGDASAILCPKELRTDLFPDFAASSAAARLPSVSRMSRRR